MSFEVLVVCTANICRSPAGETVLRSRLADRGFDDTGVRVSSAGVAARAGAAACDLSTALVAGLLGPDSVGLATPADAHSARLLTAQLVASSDLILTADRRHRNRVAELAPAARKRTFTLLQAARTAEWICADGSVLAVADTRAGGGQVELDPGDHRHGVPALPPDPLNRLAWLVEEMDAARGVAPNPEGIEGVWDADDVPDPHVVGFSIHADAIERMSGAAQTLADALWAVVTTPVRSGTAIP